MVDKNQSQKRGRDEDDGKISKDLGPQTPLRPSRVVELRRSEGRPKPRSKNTFYSPKSIWKCVKTEPWTPDEESKKDNEKSPHRDAKRRKRNLTGSDALREMSKKTSKRDKFLKESGFASSDQTADYIRLATQYNEYKKVEALLKKDCAQAGCVSDALLDETRRKLEETWIAMQGIQPYLKPIRVTSSSAMKSTSFSQENVPAFANEAQLLLQLRNRADSNSKKRRKGVVFSPITHKSLTQQKSCRCKKSKCLKLYCECFANSMFCNDTCVCLECRNDIQHMELRKTVISKILKRNPGAFRPKVKYSPNSGKTSLNNRRGCNCSKTKCLKKYCDCFSAKLHCTLQCNCVNCENRPSSDFVVPAFNVRNLNTGNIVTTTTTTSMSSMVSKRKIVMSPITLK